MIEPDVLAQRDPGDQDPDTEPNTMDSGVAD